MDFPVTAEFAAAANAGQLHDEARGPKQNWPASFTVVDGEWVYRVDRDDLDAADRDRIQAAVDDHVPEPSPVEQARKIRDDRSEAVAAPTAQLLDAVGYYLAEERGQPEPDARWVAVLEALRQLGLKGVADEAVGRGSDAYAQIYTDRVEH